MLSNDFSAIYVFPSCKGTYFLFARWNGYCTLKQIKETSSSGINLVDQERN